MCPVDFRPYVDYDGQMDKEQAILALAALAQPTRLDSFRLLVGCEPDGIAAGEIARQLAVPHNTMSTHLAVLSRAGLVSAERRSRTIIYRARLEQFRGLTTYLLQECCGGRPEICGQLLGEAPACSSSRENAA